MTTGEPLAPPEPELPLVLDALEALDALDEPLLELPHPAVSAAIAATAAIDNIQALRLDLVI